MKSPLLDKIVHAVLYEGYILYPYRASSKKNRRERFTFGRVYPKDYSNFQRGVEACFNQTEFLVKSHGKTCSLEVTARFLQPMWREVGYMRENDLASFQMVPELMASGKFYQSWQEAVERDVTVCIGLFAEGQPEKSVTPFSFPSARAFEQLQSDSSAAQPAILRRQESVAGNIEIESTSVSPGAFKVTVRILNLTPVNAAECECQDEVIMRTFASTHTILHATGGEFISLLDPPTEYKPLVAACKNIGTWPVLVGDEKLAERETMLSSPIILYDYPQIAPESEISFFDGLEIDQMLTLRVLTMTDEEKLEMRHVDECARKILERTESTTGSDFLKMHGVMRETKSAEEFFNPSQPLRKILHHGREIKLGSSVRIHPKKRADAIDMILDGKTALVEAIEEDAEGQIHLALVIDDDPGKDLGMARQPGHRFFYSLDEVELLEDLPA